jgi:hypothetical protein
METDILTWLSSWDRERVLFSDLTRVLITNRTHQRSRSHAARTEMREALTRLAAEGVVVLKPTQSGRGATGLVIELVRTPVDGSTHEGEL